MLFYRLAISTSPSSSFSHVYETKPCFCDVCTQSSLQGLALTPDDAWAVHSVAHVYEMKAEVDKGLKFMEDRESDWQVDGICLRLF